MSEDNVHNLKIVAPPNPDAEHKKLVDETAVTILEEFLERAKAGELEGVIVVATTTDDSIRYAVSAVMSRNDIIGGMERVKFDILMQMYNEN